MIKYAVNLIKNTFHPLQIAESAHVEHGQLVLVRTEKGEEVAKVFTVNPLIAKAWEGKMPPALPLIRVLGQRDLETLEEIKIAEGEAFKTCKELVAQHNLQMNLVQTKYTFDRRKITFYYTAPERVDFRGLLKDLTQTFKRVRIDLRHIGVRDETSLLEGNGLCGRPFCCKTFLGDFSPVSVKMAKEQGLSLSPVKISGTCGRLMCCLRFEQDAYEHLLRVTPKNGAIVETPEGRGTVVDFNLLTGMLKVSLDKKAEAAPITISRKQVKIIKDSKIKVDKKELEALKNISDS